MGGALSGRLLPLSDALFDEVAISGWPESDADREERIEGAFRVAPSVPSKDEFVEVALNVAFAEAVEDPLRASEAIRNRSKMTPAGTRTSRNIWLRQRRDRFGSVVLPNLKYTQLTSRCNLPRY